MAAWVCAECTTTYSVGAPRCPHCGSTKYTEEGAMPKITRHGGPTIAGASVVGGSWGNEGDPDVWPEPEAEESSDAVEPLPEPAGDVEQDSAERAAAPDYESWTVEQLKEQLGERGLPKPGKRDGLVLRLLEDDAARAAAAEGATAETETE